MTIAFYRTAIVVLLIAVVGLAISTGVLAARHNATPTSGSGTTVSSFNDGFATSKQDDCQQGFAAACTWLQSAH